MTKIRVNINDLVCNLHCPGCGGSDWFNPRQLLSGWHRCKTCGVDIEYSNISNISGLKMSAVVELHNNKTYDDYKKVKKE